MEKEVYKKFRRLKTVKFSFSLMAGFVGVFLLANTFSSSNSFVFISSVKTDFIKDERFSVDFMINTDQAVNTVSALVNFPSNILEVEGINVGRSVLTLWTEEPKVSNNEIFFSGGSFKRGFRGEHLVATIKFIAKKEGQGEISIKNLRLIAGDGQGNDVLGQVKSGLTFNIYKEKSEIPQSSFSDFNSKNNVTLKDISIFIVNWKSGDVVFDLNNDGKVNLVDFSILLTRYSSSKISF